MVEGLTPRLILVGGFLGAGKTTLLLRAAEVLGARGVTVGMVTNDQGSNLVDTALGRRHRLPMAEVSGGCFCCRFDDLLGATATLAPCAPQVILAEPVGSCTDLAATVLRPLAAMHGPQFSLAPLSVVVDAPRLLHVLSHTGAEEDDVTFLFTTQIEEADLVLLNKSDLLTAPGRTRLEEWLAQTLPGRAILPLCARRGEGVTSWLEHVMGSNAGVATQPLELDYARYARAEARMGWVNAHGILPSPVPGSTKDWAAAFLALLAARLDGAGLPVAHVKLYVSAGGGDEGDALKASIVGPAPSQIIWDLQAAPRAAAGAHWLLNARVDAASTMVRTIVEAALRETAGAGAVPDPPAIESFQPLPPRPTHRLAVV